MNDREKVISEFERCIGSFSPADTSDEYFMCVCKRALELLKEQDPVKPIRLENWWKCPSCSGNIVANMKYCPGCGQAVKWK